MNVNSGSLPMVKPTCGGLLNNLRRSLCEERIISALKKAGTSEQQMKQHLSSLKLADNDRFDAMLRRLPPDRESLLVRIPNTIAVVAKTAAKCFADLFSKRA